MKNALIALVLCLLLPVITSAGDLIIHRDSSGNSYINWSELDASQQKGVAVFMKKLDTIQLQLKNYSANSASLEKLCQEATQQLRSFANWKSTMEVVISTPLSSKDPCEALIEIVYENSYGKKVLPENRDYKNYPDGRDRWFLEKSGSEWRLYNTYYNWDQRYRNIGNSEVALTDKQMRSHYQSNIELLFGDGGMAPFMLNRSMIPRSK